MVAAAAVARSRQSSEQWPSQAGDRSAQHVLWKAGTHGRPSTAPAGEAPTSPTGCRPLTAQRGPLWAEVLPGRQGALLLLDSLESSLLSRGAKLADFELLRAQRARTSPAAGPSPDGMGIAAGDCQAAVAPAWTTGAWGSPPATAPGTAIGPQAKEVLRPSTAAPSLEEGFALRSAAFDKALAASAERRGRIESLEQGLLDFDEEKLAHLGFGTSPLLGDLGEPVLPVPPLAQHESRLPLQQRLRALSANKSAKQTLRNSMIAASILGDEVADRPLQASARGVLESQRAREAPRERAATFLGFDHFDHAALKHRSTEELLRQVEGLKGGTEDQAARVASQLCARAYDAEPADVLRMVRAVSAAAAGADRRTQIGQKELTRAADHLLQSLTGRIQDAEIDTIVEVVETMSDALVGTQVFLDMIMALILARHRRDHLVPSAATALRLASALGTVA
ncbi:unnamed protein product, partial [Polarella glacialis]